MKTKLEAWYDNIPEQGIFCWVWNNNSLIRMVFLVTSFNKSNKNYKYVAGIHSFKNAVPLTVEEIQQFNL